MIFRGQPLCNSAAWGDSPPSSSKEKLKVSVGDLSGVKQARVLLAWLMPLRPADVIVLDEPTNDLDIPSLEILEEQLDQFPGAVVLGHPRPLPAGAPRDLGHRPAARRRGPRLRRLQPATSAIQQRENPRTVAPRGEKARRSADSESRGT